MVKAEDLEWAIDQLATQVIYRKTGGEFGSAYEVLEYLQQCQKDSIKWKQHQESENLLSRTKQEIKE